MKGDPIAADNSVYRRGLILGLTLAEILLLIVFVLLLLFGAMLKDAQGRERELTARRQEALAAREQLQSALAGLSPGASPEQVTNWVQDMIAASVRKEENDDLRAELLEAESTLERVAAAVEKTEPQGSRTSPATNGGAAASSATKAASITSPSQARQAQWDRTAAKVEAKMAELAATRAANEVLKTGDKAKIGEALTQAEMERARVEGVAANAKRQLEMAGKGGDLPACWATTEGKPEYIFDIRLSGGGLMVHDRELPQWAAYEAKLPISMINFDRVLDPATFARQTRPLFDWGEAHGCRFFVAAIDETGPAEKKLFKTRLRQLEDHFYKFLAN